VQTSFQGNGVITHRHQVYERHRVHVATGTMDCTTNQTWWVEVTHTVSTSKRLPKCSTTIWGVTSVGGK